MKRIFVTAIGTDSGKTLVSAIICRALQADYWKPIQSGAPTDSSTIQQLCPEVNIHPEAYKLQLPASPHAAAKAEGVEISLQHIKLPQTTNALVIEGAGGCLVPLNDREFVIDMVQPLQAHVVLVANLYLGSINHTLLSWRLLQEKGCAVAGIVFNGAPNAESERIILQHTGYKKLLHIMPHQTITSEIINQYAGELRKQLV